MSKKDKLVEKNRGFHQGFTSNVGNCSVLTSSFADMSAWRSKKSFRMPYAKWIIAYPENMQFAADVYILSSIIQPINDNGHTNYDMPIIVQVDESYKSSKMRDLLASNPNDILLWDATGELDDIAMFSRDEFRTMPRLFNRKNLENDCEVDVNMTTFVGDFANHEPIVGDYLHDVALLRAARYVDEAAANVSLEHAKVTRTERSPWSLGSSFVDNIMQSNEFWNIISDGTFSFPGSAKERNKFPDDKDSQFIQMFSEAAQHSPKTCMAIVHPDIEEYLWKLQEFCIKAPEIFALWANMWANSFALELVSDDMMKKHGFNMESTYELVRMGNHIAGIDLAMHELADGTPLEDLIA